MSNSNSQNILTNLHISLINLKHPPHALHLLLVQLLTAADAPDVRHISVDQILDVLGFEQQIEDKGGVGT